MSGAHSPIVVRPARAADAPLLGDIQRSAGALFRTLPDIAWIADESVGEADEYLPMIAAGTVWVAEVAAGTLAGVLLSEITGQELHIVELAVAREFQQGGIGRRPMDAAAEFSRKNGLEAVTLTTFRHVGWNAPFYARYGFVELRGDETGTRLERILRAETDRGLPNRCAMRMAI